jgi:hypothetical protein
MNIEYKIEELEDLMGCNPRIRGSLIQRAIMDTPLLERYGLIALHDRECHLVWSAGIGHINQPKVFGWGHTIHEALTNAEKEIRKIIATDKKS